MRWEVQCDCGNTSVTFDFKLRSGAVKSCGCGYATRTLKFKNGRHHGMSDSAEYRIWRGMKQRCLNPKDPRFHRYGGRGITVCDRWQEGFEFFYADMGAKPSNDHSIDRINNDGPYAPENCVWALAEQQYANRPAPPNSRSIEWNGKKATLAEWAIQTGVKRKTLAERLRTGWAIGKALTTPTREY